MKILILHPDFRDPGGVAAHYRKLSGRFSVGVGHLVIGTRPGETGRRTALKRLVRDLRLFIEKLEQEHYDIVHVNPSLDPKSLCRDGMFVMAAKLLGKKVVVFFHGWNMHYDKQIQNHWRRLFKTVFGRADAFIVLSEAFKRRLRAWIGTKPIHCEFTTLDDDDLLGFDVDTAIAERLNTEPRRILFISRLLKEKGLYETIDAVRLLSRTTPAVELIVAGDGPELEPAKAYALRHGPANIRFLCYVRGEKKKEVLRQSHLLCFPTYGEGMPNTVVEAMGFGLPVITRLEGGMVDFFRNGVHGYATHSKDPRVFTDFMQTVLGDRELYRTMALNNFNFAQTHFKASQAARRLESIYAAVSNGNRRL